MAFPFGLGSRSIIGVVHLGPLPGSPRCHESRDAIRQHALADAEALLEGGIDGIVVENFGDAPFLPGGVESSTVAEMSVIVAAIVELAKQVPVGVNVLRNDAASALAIAAATGGRFIRVNVHTSAMLTDQGWIGGRAHETLRLRQSIEADSISIAADVGVKHAIRSDDYDAGSAAIETVDRGLADAVIVTGKSTGDPLDLDELQQVRSAIATTPLLAGSGVDLDNVIPIMEFADGVIVGTSLKIDGDVGQPVDVARVRNLVARVRC
ncbi:MAG: phosphorybosylanthranilate isomerase [Planctomycetota bacterium]|nr:MAG: phosphorybosylanthranilate isomerase [Planctomycetota bacterium]HIC22948.1 BtpA/SgcQ family protein [Planctomycetota bacterium]